jgi:PilZ domain
MPTPSSVASFTTLGVMARNRRQAGIGEWVTRLIRTNYSDLLIATVNVIGFYWMWVFPQNHGATVMFENTSGPERRRIARRRVSKSAHIVLNDGGPAISCEVRNLSDLGACLEVPNQISIPNTFDIQFDPSSVFRCRTIWRNATEIGVAFDYT